MEKGGQGEQEYARSSVSEPRSEESEKEMKNENASFNDLESLPDKESIDQDELLLQKIDTKIEEVHEEEKLSWAAIHHFKKLEIELLMKMEEEMKEVQQRYDEMRDPIAHALAKAASGLPIEKGLYTNHPQTSHLDVAKVKPPAIPNFWLGVFQSSGFIDTQFDQEVMGACTRVICNHKKNQVEGKTQETIKVEMTFGPNAWISNKQLRLVLRRVGNEYDRIDCDKIKAKKENNQESFLKKIFNPASELEHVFKWAEDIEKSYKNSVFFYFHDVEDEDDEEEFDNLEEVEEAEQQDEEDLDKNEEKENCPEHVDQENQKPSKKRKV